MVTAIYASKADADAAVGRIQALWGHLIALLEGAPRTDGPLDRPCPLSLNGLGIGHQRGTSMRNPRRVVITPGPCITSRPYARADG
jgi:hypothetical protein